MTRGAGYRPRNTALVAKLVLLDWAPSNVRRVISKGQARRRYIALWSGRRALEAAITSYTSPRSGVVGPSEQRASSARYMAAHPEWAFVSVVLAKDKEAEPPLYLRLRQREGSVYAARARSTTRDVAAYVITPLLLLSVPGHVISRWHGGKRKREFMMCSITGLANKAGAL